VKVRKKQGTWYIDSACSRHMTGMVENILSVTSHKGRNIAFGNRKRVKSLEFARSYSRMRGYKLEKREPGSQRIEIQKCVQGVQSPKQENKLCGGKRDKSTQHEHLDTSRMLDEQGTTQDYSYHGTTEEP
ncbi:hypothetical protein HAX54_051924, partial [Datura stramonium]|nr:hypothetical protein [Datura stramonium]